MKMVETKLAFGELGAMVARQFSDMAKHPLFRVELDKDLLWKTYLEAFPAGTNPIYRERTEHDCQTCRHFLRAMGNVVAITGRQELVTLWDVEVGGQYQPVVDALARFVKASPIVDIFLTTERTAGAEHSRQMDGERVVVWDHFHTSVPPAYVVAGASIGPKSSEARGTKDVMLRALKEITLADVDAVLELVAQNSLYRGEEQAFALRGFRDLKKEFDALPYKDQADANTDVALSLRFAYSQDLFAWSMAGKLPGAVARIRSTSIGTLLVDLAEGKDLDQAVGAYERIMAPANYKRPTALVTKAMIAKAQAALDALGFTSALERRYAVAEDLNINNVLFANRESKRAMNVFETLAARTAEKPQNFDRVDEVPIEKFLEDVMPTAETLELMVENRHAANLVSLVAPVDWAAKSMFKWNNNFSWAYAGELADSMKERVKRAGGNVTGDLRASLSWHNYDDLDLHLEEPKGRTSKGQWGWGEEIYFANRESASGGELDVDMNAGGARSRTPVENICYQDRDSMLEGEYRLFVHNYNRRETVDVGFEVELEFDGVIHAFSYPKAVKNQETVTVARFGYTHKGGLKLIESLESTQAARQMWGLTTQVFTKVTMTMLSPNYWGTEKDPHAEVTRATYGVGNKHYFFMLDGCVNSLPARGFFNEFLRQGLNEHRKVFEMVGAAMKTPESARQLSGVGFSSTQRNSVLCRVKGATQRVVKVVF